MQEDSGTQFLCAILTQEFLDFTKARGNDLFIPEPHWIFLGLTSGSK
jgi:uncharacterized protein (DUF2237 family)